MNKRQALYKRMVGDGTLLRKSHSSQVEFSSKGKSMFTSILVNVPSSLHEFIKSELSEAGCEVVCSANNRTEVSAAYRRRKPDVVLVDITGDGGIAVINDIAKRGRPSRVIALVHDRDDDKHALYAVLAGAREVMMITSESAEYKQVLKRWFGQERKPSVVSKFRRPIYGLLNIWKQRMLPLEDATRL